MPARQSTTPMPRNARWTDDRDHGKQRLDAAEKRLAELVQELKEFREIMLHYANRIDREDGDADTDTWRECLAHFQGLEEEDPASLRHLAKDVVEGLKAACVSRCVLEIEASRHLGTEKVAAELLGKWREVMERIWELED